MPGGFFAFEGTSFWGPGLSYYDHGSEVVVAEFHVGDSRAQNQPPGQFDIVAALLVIGSYGVRQAVEPEVVEVGLDAQMAGAVQAGNSMKDIVNVAAGVKGYEAEKGYLVRGLGPPRKENKFSL